MILNLNGVELDQQKHYDIDIFRRKSLMFVFQKSRFKKIFA